MTAERPPAARALAATVVCLGEVMAQIVPLDIPSVQQARTFAITHAGAESNVAVSLARLGTAAAWAGRVGDDPLGRRILDELAAAGVDIRLATVDPLRRTGLFVKDPLPSGSRVHYYRDGSAASAMDDEDLAAVLADPPSWLHQSGVTAALSPSCAKLVTDALAMSGPRGVRTSFDVNYRPVLWSSAAVAGAALADAANLADVVFVGLDEARVLWQSDDAADVRRLLHRPDVVLVKDNGAPAVAFHRDLVVRQDALKVDVVEPVGAGDAFAAGWIHAAVRGFTPRQCLRLAHLMAAVSLGSLSDHDELPVPAAVLEDRARSGVDWPARSGKTGGCSDR